MNDVTIVYFIIDLLLSMKHPHKWTVFEWRFYKSFKNYTFFFKKERSFPIFAKALIFLLAFEQMFFTWLSNFKLLSMVTPSRLTVFLFQFIFCPILDHICSTLLRVIRLDFQIWITNIRSYILQKVTNID